MEKEKERLYIEKSKEIIKKLNIDPKSASKIELSKEQAKELAPILRQLINYHDYRYYVLNSPVISDYEYDTLYKLLQRIESLYKDLITEDSPTQRVPSDVLDSFKEVKHLSPMLSLDNTYSEEDLIDWDRRVKELTSKEEIEYVVEPKYDGAGISLVYEDDILVRGATRGDGEKGEDITLNIKTIKTIPLRANFKAFGIKKVEIRGEVLITKEEFRKMNEKRLEEGLSPFANPRNAAAGSLRILDPKEVAKRPLIALVYQITYVEGKKPKTHYEGIKILHEIGFKTPFNELKLCKNIDEVIKVAKEWEEKRDALDFEIDGLVVKVNDLSLYDELGFTSHAPRWAVAYKFKPRQATTRVINVVFSVGRVGTITPIAKLEPVNLGGVTISSVSLFNEDFIKEKDIHIKDLVVIERAGEVIPYVASVVKEARPKDAIPIVFPKTCPSCGSPIVRLPTEAAYRCLNISCPAQVVLRIKHFASKDAMDIEGLGEATANLLYKASLVKDVGDIYYLKYSDIIRLPNFAEKSARNLLNAIENSKNRGLHKVIYGLGIRYVGEVTAKKLAQKAKDIYKLASMSEEELTSIEDIGPVVARSIREFFKLEQNMNVIKKLDKAGVRLSYEEVKENVLNGKSFVITGALKCCSREEAFEIIEKLGGQASNSVSTKTDYLIVGEDPGSNKLSKARKYGIKEISEEEFLQMIKPYIDLEDKKRRTLFG